jgi:hypothetical protein
MQDLRSTGLNRYNPFVHYYLIMVMVMYKGCGTKYNWAEPQKGKHLVIQDDYSLSLSLSLSLCFCLSVSLCLSLSLRAVVSLFWYYLLDKSDVNHYM